MSLNKFANLDQKSWMKIHCDDCVCETMTIKSIGILNEVKISSDVEFDQVVTPSNPPAGKAKIYVKPDDQLYILDSAGIETKVGDDSGDITNLNTKTQNISLLTTPLNTVHSGIFETDDITTNTAILVQTATPALPSAGENKLYFKVDNKAYTLNSAGLESEFGTSYNQSLNTTDTPSFSGLTLTNNLNMSNLSINSVGNIKTDIIQSNTGGISVFDSAGTTQIAIFQEPSNTLSMENHKIVNVLDPSLAQDCATKNYVDTAGIYLPLAGGTMTGNITNLQTNDTKVHLGDNAGAISQGVRAVAIGEFSGNDTQGQTSIAIGSYCASERQGANAIAIGNNAGYTDQSIDCIALGRQSGQLNQGIGSIALGLFSGNNNQATKAIAIGYDCGTATQGLNSVALGNRCANAGQGTYAVAIGNASGELNQHASSLLINAHNVALNSTASNQIILQAGTSTLQYDATALSIAGAIAPTGGNVLVTGGVYVGNANRPVVSGGYSQIAQVTVSNTVVETTLVDITGAVGTLNIPANTMRVGSTSKFFIAGLIDTNVASQDITLRLKSGATTLSTFAVTTGTNLSAGSSFTLEGNILVRTTGVTGSIITSAMLSAGNTGSQSFTRNNITTGVIDTTVINTFDFTVEWGIASVNNTITSQIISTQNVFQPIS